MFTTFPAFHTKYLKENDTARFLNCLFASFLALVGLWSVSANAFDEPFDVDFLQCNDVACADLYPGEGISHAQLIVTLHAPGSGLNGDWITYIFDYPPDTSPSISIYLNNALVSRTGVPNPQTLAVPGAQALMRNAVVVVNGIEMAFFAPQTYELGPWPSASELAELVEESIDMLPAELMEWDQEHGDGGGTTRGTPGGGQIGHAVGGLTDTDPCLYLMECGPDIGPDTPTAVGGFAAARDADNTERRIARRHRASFARTLDSHNGLQRSFTADTAPVQYGSEWSWITLAQEESVELCEKRFAICDANALAAFNAEQQGQRIGWAATCTTTVGYVAAGVAAALAAETGGGSLAVLSAAVVAGVSGTGTCTAAASMLFSGPYVSRKETCKYICAHISTLQD